MIFQEFQELRKILCLCPACGQIHRVSDLKLVVKGEVKRTWLDDFESQALKLQKKQDKFNEKEAKLREEAVQRGRLQAHKYFNKALIPAIRQFKFDPYDIKPVLHPVDFLVFNGMNKKYVKEVITLNREDKNDSLYPIKQDIKKVIINKQYNWQVARVNEFGKLEIE